MGKSIKSSVLVGALGIAGLLSSGCSSTSNPYYDSSKAHHRPDGFVNSDGTIVSKPFSDLMRWYRERFGKSLPPPPGEFYSSYDDFPREPLNTDAVMASDANITWLGHATVLLKAGELTVLTDPHFSLRAFPVQWAGPSRKVEASATVGNLPPIDVVVISHNHYDHMDQTTLTELAEQQPNTLFLVPLGVERTFESWGIKNVRALDWWESVEVKGAAVHFVPAYHWSARTLLDRNTTLWGGWVVKNKELSFYFSGDTGYSDDFKQIGERLGPFDISAIAVGAYEPRWFMKAQHVNPDESVKIHNDVRSKKSIGVHWGAFELTDEPLDQPVGDLAKAREKYKLQEDNFMLLKQGRTLRLP